MFSRIHPLLPALRTPSPVAPSLSTCFHRGNLLHLSYSILFLQLWRLATSAFCGHNVLDVVWTIWCLHVGTNLVRLNNTNESLLKLYAITQGITTLVVVVLAYITYILFDSIKLFYIEPLVGMTPINAAIMVLMKQVNKPYISTKCKHFLLLAVSPRHHSLRNVVRACQVHSSSVLRSLCLPNSCSH